MEINATLKSVGSKMLFIFNKIPLVMRLSILFFSSVLVLLWPKARMPRLPKYL